jgi:hypothetical protein
MLSWERKYAKNTDASPKRAFSHTSEMNHSLHILHVKNTPNANQVITSKKKNCIERE